MVNMEKRNRKYSPGEIIYFNDKNNDRDSCFGFVVDKDFWLDEAKKEGFLNESIDKHLNGTFKPLEEIVLFRVLGEKIFREKLKEYDLHNFEPSQNRIIHYKKGEPIYVTPVNLRPVIEISKKDNGRIKNFLFSKSDPYILDALEDAEVVYNYLDGERFNPRKIQFFKRDKLLRLLEKAIPVMH